MSTETNKIIAQRLVRAISVQMQYNRTDAIQTYNQAFGREDEEYVYFSFLSTI